MNVPRRGRILIDLPCLDQVIQTAGAPGCALMEIRVSRLFPRAIVRRAVVQNSSPITERPAFSTSIGHSTGGCLNSIPC